MATSHKGNRQKKKKGGMIPSHIQNNINKEERLMQRNLSDLERETKHRMRSIECDQQVARTKLRNLQVRLIASKKRSQSLLSKQIPPFSQMDTSDSGYFKNLIIPTIKLDFCDILAEEDEKRQEHPRSSFKMTRDEEEQKKRVSFSNNN